MQSGLLPRARARQRTSTSPTTATARGDWQGFDPADYTFSTSRCAAARRRSTREQPIIISWNQKEAPGWRKGPTEWGDGSVHHAEMLQPLGAAPRSAKGGGKIDLTGADASRQPRGDDRPARRSTSTRGCGA